MTAALAPVARPTHPTARRSRLAARPSSDFRSDVQGLRAVAVLLVVGYHLFPHRLSGGYVGVDVFFVISGFLITSHLYREVEATGRLSLARFWARRIRRLLPASLLVLAVSAAATALVVPQTLWDQTVRQIVASTLYVQNWALAGDAVDYSAAGNVPTLVQHYWSLSVEEQFYLCWPVLVVLTLVLCRRRPAWTRRGLVLVISVLGVVSLAWSVRFTAQSPGEAYFVTPTRAWEFAAGGLLGLVGLVRVPARLRAGLGWAGLAAVVGSGMAYDGHTAFPGWAAAVPVAGTVAVIAAGGHRVGRLDAARWLSQRPATWVGDLSYSVYLWHWPLIVVVPYLTGTDLRLGDKAAIFVATLALAWASTTWVENPLRHTRLLAAAPWRAFLAGLLGMTTVLGAALLLRADLDQHVADAEKRVAQVLSGLQPTACTGPAALDASSDCGPVPGAGPLLSPPEAVARQNTVEAYPGCQSPAISAVYSCDLGDTTAPRRTVAIVGDSHATQWFDALNTLGKAAHWKVVTYTRSSCPFTLARRAVRGELPSYPGHCATANRDVLRRLVADDDIDAVLVSAYSSVYRWGSPAGTTYDDPAVDGFHAIWQRLTDAGKQVVVIRDVPAVKDHRNAPDCLAEHDGDVLACSLPRDSALKDEPEADAATSGAPRGVNLVDLTDRFCDRTWCYPVVGDVIVYRDYSHLSSEYSTMLAPYLLKSFSRIDEHR